MCAFFKASFDHPGGTKSRRNGWFVLGRRRGISGCWRVQLSAASPEFPGLFRAIQPGCGLASARGWEAGALNTWYWEVTIQCRAFPGTFSEDQWNFTFTCWIIIGICKTVIGVYCDNPVVENFLVLPVAWNLLQLKILYINLSETASILRSILRQLMML